MTTTPSRDHAAAAEQPSLSTGRWQLPGGRAAAAYARRAIHNALHGWEFGPATGQVANDLADHLAPLIHTVVSRAARRRPFPIDLRLELRWSARLLLGEVRGASPGPLDHGGPASTGEQSRGIIAVTYGQRPGRDGTAIWYTHAFTW